MTYCTLPEKALLPRNPFRAPRALRLALAPLLVVAALVLLAATMPAAAAAAEANLSWNRSDTHTDGTPLTDLAGYRVYVGTASGSYQDSYDAGSGTFYLLQNLTPGATYYFAVTAYDSAGTESPFSDEVSMTFPSASGGTGYTVADALSALRYAVGLVQITPAESAHFDVAPLGADGRPQPNGTVDLADAIIILKNTVGLVAW